VKSAPLVLAPPHEAPPLISPILSAFAHNLRWENIPAAVRERAKFLILDAVGIALASTRWDFAHKSLTAIAGLGGAGECTVMGMPVRLPLRDAVLLNGMLVHGLDYDDTHVPGVIHSTASAWPCALGMGEQLHATGSEVLTAYILGVETGARLGAVAKGAFHQVGFHPTGLIGAYACALQAGKLMGANETQLTMAQGITLSTGAGSMEFLEDGSWTKRLHPGWAGVAGITAAALARQGFIAPKRAYEGRFGLFRSHLGPLEQGCDYSLATAALGQYWELNQVAVKPFPVCHFAHGCADSALEILRKHKPALADIAHIRALVPAEVIKTICEPVANKLRPVSDYDAKFSVQFIVAACLARGRFGLAELEEDALHDETILALAKKVEYVADPKSGFPKAYSGEVVVTLRNGQELRHREQVNRGAADRPLSNEEIAAKYLDNARRAVSAARAERIRDELLRLDGAETVHELCAVLGGD
jgi:2-methylcitrate dehydratase PrpD